ncbi:MAG: hypothetical protein WA666_12100 [Nitrospirota bacterium]
MEKNNIWAAIIMSILVIGCLPGLSAAVDSDPGGINALPSQPSGTGSVNYENTTGISGESYHSKEVRLMAQNAIEMPGTPGPTGPSTAAPDTDTGSPAPSTAPTPGIGSTPGTTTTPGTVTPEATTPGTTTMPETTTPGSGTGMGTGGGTEGTGSTEGTEDAGSTGGTSPDRGTGIGGSSPGTGGTGMGTGGAGVPGE